MGEGILSPVGWTEGGRESEEIWFPFSFLFQPVAWLCTLKAESMDSIDLRVMEVDDDDSEDKSMELAGDTLEERLDSVVWNERRELTGGTLFFVLTLEGVLGIGPAVNLLPFLESTFFLKKVESFPEKLLELLHVVDDDDDDDLEVNEGFGTPLRGLITPFVVVFADWIPLCVAVKNTNQIFKETVFVK